MTLAIDLDQAALEALKADALLRKVSCEEVASCLLRDYYARHVISSHEEEALFRAKVEEGREAIRQGNFYTHEDVMDWLAERRARLAARIAGQ